MTEKRRSYRGQPRRQGLDRDGSLEGKGDAQPSPAGPSETRGFAGAARVRATAGGNARPSSGVAAHWVQRQRKRGRSTRGSGATETSPVAARWPQLPAPTRWKHACGCLPTRRIDPVPTASAGERLASLLGGPAAGQERPQGHSTWAWRSFGTVGPLGPGEIPGITEQNPS